MNPKFLFKIILFFQIFLLFYITAKDSIPVNFGVLCTGIYQSTSGNHGSYRLHYKYYDSNMHIQFASVIGSWECKKNTKHILYVTNGAAIIINDRPTEADLEKYKYPVKTINKNYELGNDSYEYAKYERDITYKNYGLNIVQTTTPIDSNLIYVDQLDGERYYITQKNHLTDTILVYTNINPEFNTGWHICPDSLCTSENYDKVLEGGYGYLFRGKIYSKEETEKYWNIIEQYKLRNANEN